jgi:hypothetical protein
MNEYRCAPRTLLLLVLALACAWTRNGLAVTSKIHRTSSASQLHKGITTNMIIGSRGSLKLGRAAQVLADDFNDVWSVNSILVSGGTVYFGTSPNGGVFRYNLGELTKLYPLVTPTEVIAPYHDNNDLDLITNEHVFALGMDMTGRLLVGFSGKTCRLCRFSGSGIDTLFKPKDATYIFDIATDDAGNIFLATGPTGKVFKLDPLGKTAQLVYDSRDKNMLSLVPGRDGFLYAGSDDRGLVYKLNPRDQHATVLYDSVKPEITSLLFADALNPSQRDLYAIATSAKIVKSETEFAESTPLPGRPESTSPPPKPAPGSTGGLKLKIANAKTEPKSESSARPTPRRKTSSSTTTSSLYRIAGEGYVTTVASKMAVFLCLAQNKKGLLIGTGNNGQLLQVDPVSEQQTILYEDQQATQITTIGVVREDLYLGTANPAKLIHLPGIYAPQGQYESDLIDARQPANWGTLQLDADLPEGCKVLVSSRSGNVSDVNDPTFSAWTEPVQVIEPTQLKCPLGRFCQYRLTVKSTTGQATPVIREIAVSSTLPNLAPVVQSINLSRLSSTSKKGRYDIRYKVKDDNDDQLVYTLFFRKLGRTQWIQLADEQEEEDYEWEGRTVEDGRYEFRVVADDHKSNSIATKLTGSRISDPVVIDNTGPVVRGHFVEAKGNTTTLEMIIRDELSVIRKLDYTVDGNREWRGAIADDLVCDTTNENFTLRIDDVKPGDHLVTIRVQDDFGNTTYKSFEVVISK